MRKRLTKLALFGVLVAGSAMATEFRSPWMGERGPIRYRLEKNDPDKYSLDIYSAMHRREAHKAFMDHGTDTKPLTALFFNKSNITLNEIFPDSKMHENAKYYNPFMDLMTIYPRATYYEYGMNIGARFEYPVWNNKGRIGLRANVPFRSIEIERKNIVDKTADPTKDYILYRLVNVKIGDNDDRDVPKIVKAYNLAFVNRMFQDDRRTKAVEPLHNDFKVFGQSLALDDIKKEKNFATNIKPSMGVIYSENGKPHEPTDDYYWAINANSSVSFDDKNAVATIILETGESPSFESLHQSSKHIGLFSTGNNYKNIKTANYDNMWLVSAYNYPGNIVLLADSVEKNIELTANLYKENPYQWLWSKGQFELESTRRTGLGDVDLDLFYEHCFSDEFMGELMLGVRFPTGGSDEYFGNPYKAHLGNGEHFEIKLGGLIAWQPVDWMNLKFDASWSFVLEATEHRAAAFTGAKIKNIGPKVDADVDWGYFVGHLDFTFFHPKVNDLSTTIGYELYYKTEDNVSFKSKTVTPFYGDHCNGTTSLAQSLDNKLLENNTEAIGHKVRCETCYKLNDWLEAFGGGSFTFAGQNLPRETDFHGGINVKF